jgi:hypothetical protein
VWIEDNRNHEPRVWFEIEGLKPLNEKATAQESTNDTCATDRTMSKLEKLRALAESTPYEEEATTAMRMIYRIERKLKNPQQ